MQRACPIAVPALAREAANAVGPDGGRRARCGGCQSCATVSGHRADRETRLGMIRRMQATQNLWLFDAATDT